MIYDAVETVYAVVNANFATDYAALAAAKGVTVVTPVGIIKRQKADIFVPLGATLPAIGIYGLSATTQVKDQAKRDVFCTMAFDFYDRGTDPVALAKQTELAAEALLLSIDRMWPTAAGGAGEGDNSITVTLMDGYDETAELQYERRATITFPLMNRDVV
jgi:hypothetical protein